MTVEVLGTVLGTAIQGQIVGMANAPCLPGPGDIVANLSTSSKLLNDSEPVISLEHTVNTHILIRHIWQKILTAALLFQGKITLVRPMMFANCCLFPSRSFITESGLHDRFWCHLCYLRPLRYCSFLWCERAER